MGSLDSTPCDRSSFRGSVCPAIPLRAAAVAGGSQPRWEVSTADQLDNYQNVPYGTAAWQRSYGRRNQVENTNSRLRDKGALEPGACRALGVIARTICALAAAVTYNLALAPAETPDSTPAPVENPQVPGPGHIADANSGPFGSRAPP